MAKFIPKKKDVFTYWRNEILRNKQVYKDSVGEVLYTKMGEDATEYFKVTTPNGDSDIEIEIFDWAIDYELATD